MADTPSIGQRLTAALAAAEKQEPGLTAKLMPGSWNVIVTKPKA